MSSLAPPDIANSIRFEWTESYASEPRKLKDGFDGAFAIVAGLDASQRAVEPEELLFAGLLCLKLCPLPNFGLAGLCLDYSPVLGLHASSQPLKRRTTWGASSPRMRLRDARLPSNAKAFGGYPDV